MARKSLVAGGVALLAAVSAPGDAQSAEFGASPWLKGYTDVFGGVIPSVPGFYLRTDVYDYSGSADTTILNGRVDLGVGGVGRRRQSGGGARLRPCKPRD